MTILESNFKVSTPVEVRKAWKHFQFSIFLVFIRWFPFVILKYRIIKGFLSKSSYTWTFHVDFHFLFKFRLLFSETILLSFPVVFDSLRSTYWTVHIKMEILNFLSAHSFLVSFNLSHIFIIKRRRNDATFPILHDTAEMVSSGNLFPIFRIFINNSLLSLSAH